MPAQRGQGAKKSAFSCERCRHKKVKCDGEQPSCRRCALRNEVCEFKLNPTLSYTQRLENRIKDLESLLASSSRPLSSIESNSVPEQSNGPLPENTLAPLKNIEGLKLDQNGQISYHGPTSLAHFSLFNSGRKGQEPIEQRLMESHDLERKQRLVANAWQQRALEVFSNTPEHFQYLLDFHWSWIQPLFNFIYRPVFTRDMSLLGPYYSHALLSAILAHSARWCKADPNISNALAPYEDGAVFFRQATTLVHENLRDGICDIPTIQTCLLLSAQYTSKGPWTSAWMYSGIAFRLVEDLGINVDGRKYAATGGLSEEDIEMRNRLFWSCYFWDKMISLYFGRCPIIQFSNVAPPNDMMEDTTETEPWVPHGVSMPDGSQYPSTQAHSISSFIWICRLSEILHQLLLKVYNPLNRTTEVQIRECIAEQQRALGKWWRDIPEHLRICVHNLPAYCPPSHIVTLNCLYHTVKILAHRPILQGNFSGASQSNRDALIECVSSASCITAVFDLFCKTFGATHCVMALSYSLYMASSVFLLYIQATTPPDSKAIERIRFCVEALEKVSRVNAVIKNALNNIYTELDRAKIDFRSNIPTESTRPPSYHHTPAVTGMSSVPSVPSDLSPNNAPQACDHELNTEQQPWMDFHSMPFTPGMLETFLHLEPLSTSVGVDQTQFPNQ